MMSLHGPAMATSNGNSRRENRFDARRLSIFSAHVTDDELSRAAKRAEPDFVRISKPGKSRKRKREGQLSVGRV